MDLNFSIELGESLATDLFLDPSKAMPHHARDSMQRIFCSLKDFLLPICVLFMAGNRE